MARATDVPLQLVDVVQATIILVVAIRLAIRWRVRRALQADRSSQVDRTTQAG
jgi:ABC-type uncharacterized transport system permease subunit